jgi:hypothetical protein
VRANVGKRAVVDGFIEVNRAGERPETTSPSAPGSAEGPHAIVLLAPASRSCSKVRQGAKAEVHAARPTDT